MRRLPALAAACAACALLLSVSGCVGVAVRDRAPAPRPHPPLPSTPGYVEVEGFEVTPGPDSASKRVRLSVAYVNDTRMTFDDVVVWCRVFDADGYQLGARRWELHATEVGPMAPGFKTRRTLGIAVDSNATVDDAACALKSAR